MIIVWHRNDLRLEDHPALFVACQGGSKVLPLFIVSKEIACLGAASKWWLQMSLHSLNKEYKKRGGGLVIREGEPFAVISSLLKEGKIEELYFHHSFTPEGRKEEEAMIKGCKKKGINITVFNGNYLVKPKEILSGLGKPYTVFAPFFKALERLYDHKPSLPSPSSISFARGIKGEKIEDLPLLPKKGWYVGIAKFWQPGREGALSRLKCFCEEGIAGYKKERDFPGNTGTSLLSPHLHFGEISPREIWEGAYKSRGAGKESYLRQIGWREFASQFLYHFPKVAKKNWKPSFNSFPWKGKLSELKKWQKGETGYPIVDAGMRQLWETGWMHNRVRMIVASFLVKDLMIDWRKGAAWFWDTLVDADLANNILGWQWVAGSGPDAAPFFRIFNPVLQGEKFDPQGEYVRKYVPELGKLPLKWLHRPWEAPSDILEKAKIELGKGYPMRLVDHQKAREKTLKSYAKIIKNKSARSN